MRRVLVFGNSGSGKSTLAKRLSDTESLAHLDLDSLAWRATDPPQRKPLDESQAEIIEFTRQHSCWVIEGCYTDLLELLAAEASEIIFLDLPVSLCMANARARPWEPHKYPSKEAQDSNLDMLLGWIDGYEDRDDVFSRTAHQAFYDKFRGTKSRLTSNA